ncbi:MAG: ABC transporter substrate-binding protein [Pseudomonadota bacterium]
MKKVSLLVALVLVLGLACAPLALAGEIKIGGIFDITGATSTVGKDYAAGCLAAQEFINKNGGIGGDTVKLLPNDYAYKIPESVNLYKKYKTVDQVFAIQGWGTGDTVALAPQAKNDQIVFFSASFVGALTDPKTSPYNFFVAADYSTMLCLALTYAKDQGAKKVVFIYPDHPYGKMPIPAGKTWAKQLGLEVGPDQNVDLRAIDATSQLLAMKKFDPDYAWIGGTTPSTAVILKDAAKLGLRTKFLINCWGFDEDLPKLAGETANGRAFGMVPVAFYGQDVPGMKNVVAAGGDKPHTLHFVKGWVSMMVMAEGLKLAKKAGKLTGPGLKEALETLKDYNTGGLTPPITYTAKDHRPSTSCVVATIDGGKVKTIKEVTFPRKDEFLGK